MKYIEVFWRDAFSDSSWKNTEDIKKWVDEKHTELCKSIGWEVYTDKYYLVLSSSFNGDDEYGELTAIPKNWVVEVKPISSADIKVHV
jgi:hypothetical protein